MRKDYTAAGDSAEAEIDFVARYWTNVWKQHGDPSKRLKRILRGPEFRIMKPYLASLPGEARILDGGCGVGEGFPAVMGVGGRLDTRVSGS